jgi:predicted nucleotidyltransferase
MPCSQTWAASDGGKMLAVDVAALGGIIREVLGSGHEDVIAAYVFGSTARGTRRGRSDLDLGVLLAGEPPRTLKALKLDLEGELERRLDMPVQVVVLDRAPPDLVHRVLRDGELLLDRDPSARIRFEVRSRREYFDVLPHLKRYRHRESRVS